jgi:hypothetical protein
MEDESWEEFIIRFLHKPLLKEEKCHGAGRLTRETSTCSAI